MSRAPRERSDFGPTQGRGQGHPETTQDHLGRPKSHPGPLRTAQEPSKSHPRPLRTAQEPPKSRQEGPRRPETMQKPCKNNVFYNRFRRPRAAQDAPKEAQEAARTAPEWPGAAQGRAKREPPRVTPRCAQGPPGPAQNGSQERPGRGPKKA